MTGRRGPHGADAVQRSAPVWFGRSALRLHATLLVGLGGCTLATWIELGRAVAGHQIAWVYCFEWPLFALMGTYVWWKLVHDDPVLLPRAPRADDPAADDPDRVAWEAYLERMQAADPPGRPPAP